VEKRDAEFAGLVGVIGAGMGQDGVALSDEGLGQELAEVAEAHDGDLQPLGVVELLGHSGLVVKGLGRIDGANAEGPVGVNACRERIGRGEWKSVRFDISASGC